MWYYLMHKDIIVAKMDLTQDGKLSKVAVNQRNFAHLPLGCQLNSNRFYDWWYMRATPRTRHGVKHALTPFSKKSPTSKVGDELRFWHT